jgi:PAS domain S-box-containing protein
MTMSASSVSPDAARVPAEHLLRELLENIPESIYFKDRESRFFRVSAVMAANHGTTPGAMTGLTDFGLFGGDHARAAWEDEQRVMATGRSLVDKLEKEDWPDGSVTWCVTSKMPLRDESGAIIGTFGISRDVTESRRVREQLEKTSKDLFEASRKAGMADVATGVLHNVGNVLNTVNIAAEQLAEGLRKSRIDGVARLAELLKAEGGDLPGFFSTERGRQVPVYVERLAGHLAAERDRLQQELVELRRSIDHIKDVVTMQQSYASAPGLVEDLEPAELLEDALRLNVAALTRHDVFVEREFAPASRVRVDRSRVLQILVNLVRNAKHALDDGAPERKRMILRVAPGEPGRVRLVVADNGVGIPPENLEKIFTHGFTTRKKGHGFGLHSAAVAAGEMGGSLGARSGGPGLGAEFILELPAAPEAPGAADGGGGGAVAGNPAAGGGDPRGLIVSVAGI